MMAKNDQYSSTSLGVPHVFFSQIRKANRENVDSLYSAKVICLFITAAQHQKALFSLHKAAPKVTGLLD
jgi:hypothetical protein